MKGNLLKYWDGSAWKPVNGSSGGTGPSTAAELAAVVPEGLTADANVQSVLDALAEKLPGEELIAQTYYYGDLNYKDGTVIDNTTAYQRTTGQPIDCINKGLKLKVPLTSTGYKENSDAVLIRFFAYDAEGKYVGGVEPDGTILKPGQQQRWASIKHGTVFTLKKGYGYKFVNSNASGTNTFKTNEAALNWLQKELKVYRTSGSGSGGSLPDITPQDEGAFLRVQDGTAAWAKLINRAEVGG